MTKRTRKSDAQLKRDIEDELIWDTRVKEAEIGVELKDGIVTLTGTVDSWTERMAAQEAAHRVDGIHDVANDIRVRVVGARERTDTDIAKAVRHALQWDVLVPDERIESTVSKGVVTLEGTVELWNQHDDASRAVRNLAGVGEVRNLIKVAPRKVAPQLVREAIEGALKRHAEHAGKHVEVIIEDDEVILKGEVPSWSEAHAIIGAVKGTPGVRGVRNMIGVHE